MDITCKACAVTVAETDDDQQTRHRCAITGEYVDLNAPCALPEEKAWHLARFFARVALLIDDGCITGAH